MKNSTIIGITIIFTILISCGTRRKVGNHPIIIEETSDFSIVLPDSTKEPGYNPRQRVFAYYLMSLPKEELEKWRSIGTFSEQEKDRFLNKIDSLKKENDTLR
ncbi:MAG: hypothetical protein FJX99_05415 [Bacteroidetes bacterium]|nr:hypothetical protein [Bacteroidota bacterium]